jgi:hypothetical protein
VLKWLPVPVKTYSILINKKRIMKQVFSFLLLLLAAGTMVSGKKSKSNGDVSFQLRTQNKNATIVAGRMQSGTLNWVSGSVFVDKIDFEAEKDDDQEWELESRVRRKVDLFGSVAQLGSIQLAPGRYDEIEVELDLGSPAGDTALVLRGTYLNNSGATVPVVFFMRDMIELKAEAENVVLSGTGDYNFLTTFNLAQLTSGVAQSQLNGAALTNGVLVISANSNSSLYSKILSNINNMDGVELDD